MWAMESLKTHLADGLPPGLEPALQAFAVKTFRPAAPTLPVPCNQGLQRAAGLAYAAKLFPSAPGPLRRSWQAYAGEIWALVVANVTFTLSAPDYAPALSQRVRRFAYTFTATAENGGAFPEGLDGGGRAAAVASPVVVLTWALDVDHLSRGGDPAPSHRTTRSGTSVVASRQCSSVSIAHRFPPTRYG